LINGRFIRVHGRITMRPYVEDEVEDEFGLWFGRRRSPFGLSCSGGPWVNLSYVHYIVPTNLEIPNQRYGNTHVEQQSQPAISFSE
jgi:hypothetical protein